LSAASTLKSLLFENKGILGLKMEVIIEYQHLRVFQTQFSKQIATGTYGNIELFSKFVFLVSQMSKKKKIWQRYVAKKTFPTDSTKESVQYAFYTSVHIPRKK
jgi:hypothetical protein